MQNMDIDECVFTSRTCAEMDFESLGQLKIRSTGLLNSTAITVIPDRQMKFDLDTAKEIKLPSNLNTFQKATGDCDNFVMESHYKVYFS